MLIVDDQPAIVCNNEINIDLSSQKSQRIEVIDLENPFNKFGKTDSPTKDTNDNYNTTEGGIDTFTLSRPSVAFKAQHKKQASNEMSPLKSERSVNGVSVAGN
jgi:hypothetical protein